MSRTLIFSFDGTWNGRDDTIPTNILKLHRAFSHENQVPFYFAGPGNEDENGWFTELLGGAFGVGSFEIRDMALATLRAVYQYGDRIVAIGFSRGAAIARMFASEIYKEDINGYLVDVDFLGCFDTVGAYLPIGPSQQGLFHDLHVSPVVQSAYHAVAIDENRKTFTPNLMNKRDEITEVWFPGVHTDIGGGQEDTGLSDITLKWMADNLTSHGVVLSVNTQPDYETPIGHNGGLYRRETRRIGVKVDGEWSDIEPIIYKPES
jgi:uncharacterized protein (DUF2235 family)